MVRFDELPVLLTIERAGRVLGLSKTAAYAMEQRGELKTRRIGRRKMVPRGWLAEFCGESVEQAARTVRADVEQLPGAA